MKNILESIKKLYANENKAKQHWMLIWLILFTILPFICLSYLQSDSSITEMKIILSLGAIFGILAIIPFLALCGATIDYYNGRLNNQTGLFDVTLNSIKKGLKIFPLNFVWTIYITFAALFPMIALIPYITINIQNFGSITFLLSLLLLMLLYVVYALALGLLVVPFYSYIIIEYAKDYKYKKYLFNPLTICKYMKKAFNSTVITNLKLYVANIILNMAYYVIILIAIILFFMFVFFAILSIAFFNPSDEIIENISVLCSIPIITVVSVIITYAQMIIVYAVGDIYVKIYKTEIEPQENTEEIPTIEESSDEE
jgi:hypothetical protein